MLITCPECSHEISDKAVMCPYCGFPISKPKQERRKARRLKLPNGFGQISEIKNRRLRKPFRAMITIGTNDLGRPICKPLKPTAYFETYNEAYAALMEYHRNPYDPATAITVEELFKMWSESKYMQKLNSATRARKYTLWNYAESIKNLNVIDVRSADVRNVIENGTIIYKGHTQKPTEHVQIELKVFLKQLFDYAVEYEYITQNPAEKVTVVSKADMETKHHISFTDAEMETLWANIDKPVVRMMLVQCYTGFRPAELCSLKLSNIDLDKGSIVGGKKTRAGTNRIVPIHKKIRTLVEDAYNESTDLGCPALFHKLRLEDPEKPMPDNLYRLDFMKMCTVLGLEPGHRPHDCRKQFVTMAKKYNVDEYAIKRIVGHAITDITENVYTERDFGWLCEEINKIK